MKTLKFYVGWRVSLISRSRKRGLGRDEHGVTNGIISFCLICDTPTIENIEVLCGVEGFINISV